MKYFKDYFLAAIVFMTLSLLVPDARAQASYAVYTKN